MHLDLKGLVLVDTILLLHMGNRSLMAHRSHSDIRANQESYQRSSGVSCVVIFALVSSYKKFIIIGDAFIPERIPQF